MTDRPEYAGNTSLQGRLTKIGKQELNGERVRWESYFFNADILPFLGVAVFCHLPIFLGFSKSISKTNIPFMICDGSWSILWKRKITRYCANEYRSYTNENAS